MIKTTPGTDTMEEEVGSTRRSLGEKAEHLRERLSSGDFMESIMEFARSNGGAIASGVSRTVREHPVPIAMIGAGIAWLAFSSRRGDDDDYASGYGSGAYHREHKEGMTDRLKERASAAGESLRERASDLGERAGELGYEARRQASRYGRSGGRFVKDHPILIGAAGIALGAALAAALPRTSREDDVFGERAERTRQAAKDAALREGRKVQEAAKAAVEKAREAASEKAPTAGDLKRDVERTAKAAAGQGTGGQGTGGQGTGGQGTGGQGTGGQGTGGQGTSSGPQTGTS